MNNGSSWLYLWYKPIQKYVYVYDITYDAITGYPQFLIYEDGQWLRLSAKHFAPAPEWEEVIR